MGGYSAKNNLFVKYTPNIGFTEISCWENRDTKADGTVKRATM